MVTSRTAMSSLPFDLVTMNTYAHCDSQCLRVCEKPAQSARNTHVFTRELLTALQVRQSFAKSHGAVCRQHPSPRQKEAQGAHA